jgi:hypothetical protein
VEEFVIQEHVTSGRGALISSPGLLRGVKLLGLNSANGHRYTPAALERAVSLYEGVKVNVDHPPRGMEGGPRAYRDRIGRIENVRVAADGLFGDLRFNPEHPLAKQLVWDAEHAPENLGLSHNAQGRGRRDGEAFLVEEITAVRSVDLVADPATTRGLFESRQPAESALLEQIHRIEQQLTQLQSEHAITRLLASSGLPTEALTPRFYQTLTEAQDDIVRRRLIEDRRRTWSTMPASSTVSVASTPAEFAKRLKQ